MRKPRVGAEDFLDKGTAAKAPKVCPDCGGQLFLQFYRFFKFPLIGARLRCRSKEITGKQGYEMVQRCRFSYLFTKPYRAQSIMEVEFGKVFVDSTAGVPLDYEMHPDPDWLRT